MTPACTQGHIVSDRHLYAVCGRDGADTRHRTQMELTFATVFFVFFSLLPWAPYVFPVLLYQTGDLSMEESCLPSAYWHGLQLLK